MALSYKNILQQSVWESAYLYVIKFICCFSSLHHDSYLFWSAYIHSSTTQHHINGSYREQFHTLFHITLREAL